VYSDAVGDELQRKVEIHDPDYVVLISRRYSRCELARSRGTVLLAEHCGERRIDDLDFPSLLYADEVDLLGSRAAGRRAYDYDAEQLLIEVEPDSGLSHVTKLQFTCFPLVRYNLGQLVPATAKGP
jgi:hypothetical protein